MSEPILDRYNRRQAIFVPAKPLKGWFAYDGLLQRSAEPFTSWIPITGRSKRRSAPDRHNRSE